MQFSEDVLMRVTIFVLGIAGFWVAKHIRDHKIKDVPLVCPIGFDCNAVVHSDYSKFMSVPVEMLGMIYYGVLSLAYLFFIFWSEMMPNSLVCFLMLMSLGAFLFSLYLIFVQIFLLKKGCSWCIVSALISAAIFGLTMMSYDFSSFARLFV